MARTSRRGLARTPKPRTGQRGADRKIVTAFGGVPAFTLDWDSIEATVGRSFSKDERDGLDSVVREYLIRRAAEKAAVPLGDIKGVVAEIRSLSVRLLYTLGGATDAEFGAVQEIQKFLPGLQHPRAPEGLFELDNLPAYLGTMAAACLKAESSLSERSQGFGSYQNAWRHFVSELDAWADTAEVHRKWANDGAGGYDNVPPYVRFIDVIMNSLPDEWRHSYNSPMPALGQAIREARKGGSE